MASRYTVNGQEMSEEEFRAWQETSGFRFGGGFNAQRQKWDRKMHLYQCYKNTPQGLWNEIDIDEFKYDTNKVPNFTKKFFYINRDNRDYDIIEMPAAAIFYDHVNDKFLYMKIGGLIAEESCFATSEDALSAINKIEAERYNTHTLYDANGNVIMIWKPTNGASM